MRGRGWTTLRHGVAWLPFLTLLFDTATGRLSPNPIQDWTLRTGRAALLMLVLSLSVTPATWWRPLRGLKPWRRTWGLYAFAYAVLHVYILVGVDYTWRLDWLWADLGRDKPYAWYGAAAWLLLAVLAATSPRRVVRALGARRWKAVHRAVYGAALLAVVHQALAVKGNVLTLQGDVRRPLLAGLAVAGLLLARAVVAWQRRRRAVRRALHPTA